MNEPAFDLDGHPAAERLAALAEGDVSGKEREALTAHVADCAICAQAVQFAIGLETDSQDLSERWAGGTVTPIARKGPASRRWMPALALAASLAVGVSALFIAVMGESEPDATTRGVADDVVPASGATLNAPPKQFEWPEGQAGQFVLMNERAEILFRSEAVEAPWSVPSEVLAHLDDGGTFLWQVELRHTTLGPFQLSIDD